MSLLALRGSSGDHSSHSLMEYGQFPFPSTSVPQDNLFQERSHSQSKWNLWWSVITTPFSFSFKAKFINVISSITIIVLLVIRMLCFKRYLQYGFLCIVNFISFKEMLQNTEDLAKKRMYEMVCQGKPVLMWFVIWHNKESSGHNMEMNEVQITTMLQFHIT